MQTVFNYPFYGGGGNVVSSSPEYLIRRKTYQRIFDCLQGSDYIKRKTVAYLPCPDGVQAGSDRYNAYISRATFVNFPLITLKNYINAAFSTKPTIEIQDNMYFLSEAEARVYLKSLFRSAMSMGAAGVEVIFDNGYGQNRDIRLNVIKGEQIIKSDVNENKELVLVVYNFLYKNRSMGSKYEWSWMVGQAILEIDEDGYFKKTVIGAEKQVFETSLKYIPFAFCGSDNNDNEPDTPPLDAISELSIDWYNMSADVRESNHITGQPTAVINDKYPDQYANNDNDLKGGGGGDIQEESMIKVGSRQAISNVDAYYITPPSSTSTSEAMKETERLIFEIGSAAMGAKNPHVTAETARIQKGSESATVASVANNVEECFTIAVIFACDIAGIKFNSSFRINANSELRRLTYQEMHMMTNLVIQGIIPAKEFRDGLRESDLIRMSEDEIEEELVKDSSGVNLEPANLGEDEA